MKIKIIDLLNMISKGEELPKKININGGIQGVDRWVYDEHYQDYKNGADVLLLYSGMTSNHLNDEIEIIEDTPKQVSERVKIKKIPIGYKNHTHRLRRIEKRLNEIIDYINNN